MARPLSGAGNAPHPLSEAVDQLAGDPVAVAGQAAAWRGMAAKLVTLRDQYGAAVETRLWEWTGGRGRGVPFRINNLASNEEQTSAYQQMTTSVLAFFGRYPGNALLAFNGEYVIVEQRNGEVVTNGDWNEDSFDQVWMADIVAGYPRRSLAQPLM